MNEYAALQALRIGCVKYLNSVPLIEAYRGAVRFEHPADLARDLAAGELDAALVPVFEALRAGHYLLVDGVGIAARGAVYSVFLAYRGELAAVERIWLDPASLSSQHLLKVLLAEYHGLRPEYLRRTAEQEVPEGEAQLLIGNQAIEFRQQHGEGWQYLDLGEEWLRQTSLPFIFALWLLRPDVADAPAVAEAFRALKAAGLAQLEKIIARETTAGQPWARKYLTEYIRFDVGPQERAGLQLYQQLLVKHGFIAAQPQPLVFV